MTSALDRVTARPVVPAEPPTVTEIPSRLIAWANDARQAATVAVSLARTPFVPQSLRGNTEELTRANITAAILTGQELGFEPMASLRTIDIIQGTPAVRAVALRALVQGAGHAVWVAESTAERAVVKGHRAGDDAHVQESVWTIDRARALGLVSKDNWKKQPGAMLVARATSELCRMIASDVILGVPYSAEELRDETPEASARQRVSVAEIVQSPAAAPSAPEPTELPCDTDPAEMTEAEWAKDADS